MDRIEDIVAQTQRRVKGESDSDKAEFSNHLNNAKDEVHWIDNWLSDPPNLEPHSNERTDLDRAKAAIAGRINTNDFRDRFPDKQNTEVEPTGQDWFEKILSDAMETYSRCLDLVK